MRRPSGRALPPCVRFSGGGGGGGLLVAKTLCAFYGVDPHVSLTTISIPFVMYAVWYFIPSSKWPTGWTSCSFPLFVMHMSIIPFFVAVLKRTPLGATQLEGVAVFIGATAASIGIALMLRRFFPRVNAFLFAGRS